MAVTQSTPEQLTRWQQLRPETIAPLEPAEALAELQTDLQGLSSQEAAIRLEMFGLSNLQIKRAWRGLFSLLSVFIRPILLPLWLGAIISFAIDRDTTGWALLLAALANTVVAAIQERKVERATAALHDVLPSYARVLRNDGEEHILTSMLVPGDILLLRPGDIIPADARLVMGENLHTANPVLRGDDTVIHKSHEAMPADEAMPIEMRNIVFAGGRVTSGQGKAVVFATGLQTAFGQIAMLTQRAHEEPSPLLLAFNRLGLVVLIVGLVGALGGYSHVVGNLGLEVELGLLVAVLFLTAAVPTGLMPAVTLALIEGARRLRRQNAIFRRLSNVETLGATTVICSDKTGTLTQNEMTVRELWTSDHVVAVSGVGYQPRGEFRMQNQALDAATTVRLAGPLLRAAVLTSTARLLPPDTFKPTWHILGDPVEAALLVAAAKAGIKAGELYEALPQLAALNSDLDLALDGVIVDEAGGAVVFVKGPPAALLARCTAIATEHGDRPITDRDRQHVKRTLQGYQRDAMRTIAFARRTLARDELRANTIGEVVPELTLLGMIAVVDPPREEVAEAIQVVHSANIRTIMLTGDDTIGATSVARRCTMVQGSKPFVVSGPELEAMDQRTLEQKLRSGDMVLARLTPEQKVRVVEALEDMGEVVCVTGGAASDVPALKAAYTGIAMGATGSPAAMAAADIVLSDDNFATIADAIAEGRAVEQRVRRLVMLNLATTVVKLVALIAALAAGWPLLLTVGQQLLIDFLAGLLPGLALGAGRPDPRLMLRSPRPTGRPLLSRKVYLLGYAWFGGLAGLLALAVVGTFLLQQQEQIAGLTPIDLFASNLLPYEVREAEPIGQSGLIATSLYVVMSVAALLGVALIRRSAAPNDWRPLVLLYGLVGLSFALLVGIIVFDGIHPYIALTNIPVWGWIAALGAVAIMAILERIRQRIDPIFKPETAAPVAAPRAEMTSAHK